MEITVILPVHRLEETEVELYKNAVKSVGDQKSVLPKELLVVCHGGEELRNRLDKIHSEIKEMKVPIRLVENTGNGDFSSQINFGAANAATEWISYLELDDEYSSIWFDNAALYHEAYPEVQVFMPITLDVTPENRFISFSNEALWAMGFSEVQGFLDHDVLDRFPGMQLAGAVMKRELFEEYGGFKPSMKLTFTLELMLRWTYGDIKMMTIPKLGYKHTNMREGSLLWNYRNVEKMTPQEGKFWMNTAKREFFFKEDRGIIYTPKQVLDDQES